jgi:hypothetical protein
MGWVIRGSSSSRSWEFFSSWVPGAVSQGSKAAQGVKLTTYLHLVPNQECVELYIHSTNMSSWHGAQLKRSTGRTVPFACIKHGYCQVSLLQLRKQCIFLNKIFLVIF